MNSMTWEWTDPEDDVVWEDYEAEDTEGEAVETVAFLDNDTMEPILELVNPMSVEVERDREVTVFTVEDGTERSDHIVEGPLTISIELMITEELRDTYADLVDLYESNELVSLQTKTALHNDLIILSIPYSEAPEVMSGNTGTITLQEWREVEPEYGSMPPRKVAKKAQADTVETSAEPQEWVQLDRGYSRADATGVMDLQSGQSLPDGINQLSDAEVRQRLGGKLPGGLRS